MKKDGQVRLPNVVRISRVTFERAKTTAKRSISETFIVALDLWQGTAGTGGNVLRSVEVFYEESANGYSIASVCITVGAAG